MGGEYRNVHGRKWGRGARPYLLILKLVSLATFVGGLASLLLVQLIEAAPATTAAWNDHVVQIHRAFTRVILPGAVGTLASGMLLASAHFRIFLRMRWFRLKVVLLIVGVPLLHLLGRGGVLALAEAVRAGDPAAAAGIRTRFILTLLVTLGGAVVVLILGRVKPRLGQDYGRTLSAPTNSNREGQAAGRKPARDAVPE